jgi:purine-binding chemotaxis protein CheW
MRPKGPRPTEALDWKRARARLERALAATEESWRLTPARARAILEERARKEAQSPAAPAAAGAVLEAVVFSLGNEKYALETRFVREVVRLGDYTPLPGSPSFLLGVLNLRGEILAVMDLRSFFGIAEQAQTDFSRVLVLGTERAEFGLLADAAQEVCRLRQDEVLEPPGSVVGAGREYVRGVTREALVFLDGAVLLHDRRLFIDQDEGAGR